MDPSVEPNAVAADPPLDLESTAENVAGQVVDATSKWFQESGTDSANE